MRTLLCGGLIAVLVLVLAPRPLLSYTTYNPGGQAAGGCAQCHGGFVDQGWLHDAHAGAERGMSPTCGLCHRAAGDNPQIGSGGVDPNRGCNGCHLGSGLQAHHANADVGDDLSGLACADCHDEGPPAPESAIPPFYLRSDVALADPCQADAQSGGEDYIRADGRGLDNDGDLLYEQDDPDCGSQAGFEQSWGTVKSAFR